MSHMSWDKDMQDKVAWKSALYTQTLFTSTREEYITLACTYVYHASLTSSHVPFNVYYNDTCNSLLTLYKLDQV